MAAHSDTATKELHQEIGLASDCGQYLTFTLGDEHYGIDILRVQEIKGYSAVTRIPNTPAHIKGVLNLRGTIVPIVDLRSKFGMPETEYTLFTVIVVVVVRDRIMGLIVDAVSDVLSIAHQDLHPCPNFGTTLDLAFVRHIAKCGDRLVTLLEIDAILADAEPAAPTQVAA